jgi:hypothetical protein
LKITKHVNKHTVGKVQVFNCKAGGTYDVFKEGPRTGTLQIAYIDGLNSAVVQGSID